MLTGTAGSGGTATGRARVLTDPSDPSALEPGDVLVAESTDPAWTPLFVPAGAVVTSVGALGSHTMIVSRELGIPCVVSVEDATLRIPDGVEVVVDGTKGTVTVGGVSGRVRRVQAGLTFQRTGRLVRPCSTKDSLRTRLYRPARCRPSGRGAARR